MIECPDCGAEFTKQGMPNHRKKCGEGWRKPELLRKMYHEKGQTIEKIANEVGTSDKNVYAWMDKFDIETHRGGPRTEQWKQKEVLREEYHENGLSYGAIAAKYGVGKANIQYWMEKHGIERRGRLDYQTKTPPKMFTDTDGYEQFTGPDKSVKHHSLVAISSGEDPSKVFGGEHHVHHKNNIPWDNRPSNVEVMTHSEHMSLTQAARRGDVEYANE